MPKELERKNLIEELGVHFEKKYNFPPLAARIYSQLILTEEDGLTFEDCLSKRGASKSSISTSLNLLLQLETITYFTKSGDRKRYFKISDNNTFFLNKLEDNLKNIIQERVIIKKVEDYNKTYNTKKYRENNKKTKLFLNYLDDNEKLLKHTIEVLHLSKI